MFDALGATGAECGHTDAAHRMGAAERRDQTIGVSGPPRDTTAPGHGARTTAVDDAAIRDEADGSGFTSIGLPAEAGWYASAALYWIGGLAVVLIDQFSAADTVPTVIGVFGTMALAASPLLLLGARYAGDAAWGVAVRILSPLLILAVGGAFVGDAISALVLILLFPVLAVAYMHKPILAIPYCTVSLSVMAVMLLAYDDSGPWIARVIVLTGVTAALVAGLVISQNRLRTAAAANHERSVTDPLTGLANLRGLRIRLQQELLRASRDQSQVVMFAIDLDDFKEVNDRFSYALGDAVLQAVAQTLSEEADAGDLVARRGGDEFAVLAISAPGRHMARFGDRLAAAIERTRRSVSPAVNPSASISRVTHEPGESPEAFLRRVDEGLHAAKIAAHPERAGSELDPEGEQPEIGLDEHRARMLDGARRVQAGNVAAHGHRRSTRTVVLEWRIASGTALVTAVLAAIVVAADLLSQIHRTAMVACIAVLIPVALVERVLATRRPPRSAMHAAISVTLAATIALVALAGPDRYALAELCVLPVPLAVGVFSRRASVPYAIAGGGAYAWFLLTSSAPFAELQVLTLVGVLFVLVVLLQRGEHLADEFSATAEALSIVDPLTGTGNLRGLRERVRQEIARADTTGSRLCVSMIDLDRFKAVNDRYSHSMGDALLIETARAIEGVVREDELVVRRGGDEFAVVSATMGDSEIDALAARVREAILAARLRLTPDLVAGATVVNVLHEPGESPEAFMARADETLRHAKARERTPAARGV